MTAGQPQNETATSVFYVYLNSFPYLRLGYGAALSMILAGAAQRGDTVRVPRESSVVREAQPGLDLGVLVGGVVSTTTCSFRRG